MRLQKILAESYLNCTGHFWDEGSLGITLNSPGEPLGTSGSGQTFTVRPLNERQLSSAVADAPKRAPSREDLYPRKFPGEGTATSFRWNPGS
jgi:hypothetical protein